MSSLVKVKLLKIAKSGAFATFSPQQLDECRSQILSLATDKLTNSEIYSILELQFYISLLTNHDVEAKAALDRLLDQFAVEKSQKLKILRSLYLEAIGEDERAIKILTQDPDELDLSRRLTTFSRKKKEVSENLDGMSYISNLIFYLDLNPSDIKTWAELAGEYSKRGTTINRYTATRKSYCKSHLRTIFSTRLGYSTTTSTCKSRQPG